MIDVVGAEHRAGKLLQQVGFFVRDAARADHAHRLAAARVANLTQLLTGKVQCLFPAHCLEFAIRLLHQRLRHAVFAVGKVKAVAALDAEKVSVQSALVAVVAAHNFHAVVGAPHTQRRLATVAAVCADGAHVSHFPRAGLVAVGA